MDVDDGFTITIGEQQFVVSAAHLQLVSPVFRKMLTVEMREKADRKVDIKDTDAYTFGAFLEAISLGKTFYAERKLVLLELDN